MARSFINAGIFIAVVALVLGVKVWEDGGRLRIAAAAPALVGAAPAPEFPRDLDWINTGEKKIALEDLRGKVVLLDFWTYGCINCFHIIPDLKRLEAKYGNALVVIGVHSAKFESEGDTRRIRSIAQRYERDEPIVNDNEFEIWRAYGARAWPTLVLIDPAGNIVGQVAGEGHYDLLDEAIGRLVETFAERIDRTPLELEPALAQMEDTFLRFPGKILADEKTQRLFIADSNHHRIVVTDYDGNVETIIGNGKPGLGDGDFNAAQFHQPQGLALDGNTLYVADTLNSAIRRVDLETKTVESVAGTGDQVYMRRDAYPAKGTPLNSPWDVLWHEGKLYIAMAGQHQLWRYDPQTEKLEAYAGTRREALTDGPRLKAALNQPSGLATDGKRLYFADAEASAIRYVDFESGEVKTIVGTGLFDFGDVDGRGKSVRLQHPLGITAANGKLYVADTYNDKIKVIDPEARTSKTLVGGDGELFEPGGLHFASGRLWIADTNNHAIAVTRLDEPALKVLTLQE
ncbi:MAG: redoxin domain-containing protein [Proteobacteria bacterium]|nr:redoxin domain-containing protein [Pseudomonadota bacterium]